MTRKIKTHSVLLLVIFVVCSSVTIQAQFKKKITRSTTEIELKRKLAPYVVIKNKRIKVIALAQGNTPKEVPEILKTKLITDVLKGTGFVVDEYNPETVLKFTVTAFDVEFRNSTYQSGNTTMPYTMVNGTIEVSYQAIEVATNAPVDSENLVDMFKQDFPSISGQSKWSGWIPNPWGTRSSSIPPSQSEVRNLLLNSVVKQMAVRAAPVEERFPVLLPHGKLDQLSKIAKTRSWAKLLEGAEAMSPLKEIEDDSYRIYLVGLANEALAYDQPNNEAVRNYLFKARKAYEEARTKKSSEEEYIGPWTRVDKAVSQYDKISRQAEEYQKYLKDKANPPVPSPPVIGPGHSPEPPKPTDSGNTGNSKIWTNRMVIQSWQSKVSEKILLQAIANETEFKFDTSPKGLGELAEAGVPDSVVSLMMEKATGKKSPPPQGSGDKSTTRPPQGSGGKKTARPPVKPKPKP